MLIRSAGLWSAGVGGIWSAGVDGVVLVVLAAVSVVDTSRAVGGLLPAGLWPAGGGGGVRDLSPPYDCVYPCLKDTSILTNIEG